MFKFFPEIPLVETADDKTVTVFSMCNQMVSSEKARAKGSGNYKDLDKTRVKLFPNFTSIPFDYLLIS